MATGDETLPDRGPTLFEQIAQACVHRLAAKPKSKATLALRDEALACQRELDAWRTTSPTEEASRAMRTRLLALNAKIDAL